MANPEHLAKLNEGVEAWNKWREENPEIKPDLEGANLNDVDLEGVNLNDAKLRAIDLKGSNLFGANLNSADLENAGLFGANLKQADLFGANLFAADLFGANLFSTNLRDADLRYADLSNGILFCTDLTRVQALNTNFEGATLTGACIKDWNINSNTNLQDVKCDYIYLKKIFSKEEEQWNFSNRVPHDPDKIFAPGEFTKRYQKILETVNLYFGKGIDWQVFLSSFQKLQEEEKIKIAAGEREIPIVQGIKNTGDSSFLIEIGVSPDTDKGEIEKSFWQKYQKMLDEVEKKYRLELNFKDEQIQFYRQNYTQVLDIIKLTASQPINIQNTIDNQNLQGDNNMTGDQNVQGHYYQTSGNVGIVHNEGTVSGNAKVAGVINEAAQQDLAQAAAEIQQLLDQFSKTYPTETFAQKGAVADQTIEEIKNNPTLLKKVINVIKAMGIEALAEAVDNPIFNIAKAGIEAALESKS